MIITNKSKSGEHPGKRGVAFIISIMISSVALAVGLGVYNRTYKQLLLGSFWKQTQTAFYAAESGLECAKYLDKEGVSPVECFAQTISGWTPGTSGVFQLGVGAGCVEVTITESNAPDGTIFTSRGYNTCDTTSARRVERVLEFWSPATE